MKKTFFILTIILLSLHAGAQSETGDLTHEDSLLLKPIGFSASMVVDSAITEIFDGAEILIKASSRYFDIAKKYLAIANDPNLKGTAEAARAFKLAIFYTEFGGMLLEQGKTLKDLGHMYLETRDAMRIK